jgi:membrane protease YdiL (CAAX protease family)
MEAAVMVVGLGAEAVAWWFVGFRRANVWATMTPVLGAMGLAALLVEPPAWSPEVVPSVSAAVGLGGGVVLYLATRAFVAVVRPWEAFARHSVGMYVRQGGLSLAAAVLVSVVLVVPGEELFWRGLVRPELAETVDGRLVPAVLAWAAYVAANLPSANLAIVAGAVVGGAAWTVLGTWSGGVLAPLVCHGAWTACMIAFPVVRPPAGGRAPEPA